MSKIVLKQKSARKAKSKNDNHYVNNKEFLNAFIEYNKAYKEAKSKGEQPPKIPDYIGMCFIKIAEKFSNHKSFIGYPYKDEMIADAIENCIMYAYDFDPNRGTNPFAYFTTVVWHAFVRRINKENKNKYIVYKSHQMKSFQPFYEVDPLTGYQGTSTNIYPSPELSENMAPKELYDNITSYIDDYEKKIKEKKMKKKPKTTKKT